jgi:cobalt-zinc-cadmium efflux system outer membrane protein
MKRAALLMLFLTVACNCALTATIETNELRALTLEQAITIAERLHPTLAEADALTDAAKGRAKQAGAFPNPEAIARVESAGGSGPASAEYLAGISQPLPLSRRVSKARQAEELEAQRLSHEREARRIELRRRVHNAFATGLYQERAYQAQKQIADTAAKLVAIVKARIEAGDAVAPDLAKAELEAERANIELQRASSLREQGLSSIATAIGDARLSIRSLEGNLETTWDLPALEELAGAIGNHPSLLAAKDATDATRARLDLARAQRIPDVRAEVLYRRLEGENQNTFDVGVAIPLPLFDRNSGRIRETRAEIAAAEARALASENDLRGRLRESHRILRTALNTSRAFTSNIVPRAQTVLKTAEERYALGDISLSELLPIRRDWNDVELMQLEMLRGVIEAWAEVRSLSSRLD